MPSLTLSDRLIWFAHCPKAGGTSIEQLMVARWGDAVGHLHWGWDLWWRGGGWRVADPPNSPQHLTWADALRQLERPPDAVFALVRDPAKRMASEHRWQRSGRRGTWLGKLLAWLPFSLWLRVMLAVAARNPHAFDNHLRPQTDFVPPMAQVFRLEDGMEPVAAWLEKATGTPATSLVLPHALSTHSSATRISSADAHRITAAFGVDYERFGYPRPTETVARDALDHLARLLAPIVTKLDKCGSL